MAVRYIEICKGITDGHFPVDRSNALAAGILVDSNDSYKLKYQQNGTLVTVPDSTNGVVTAGPFIQAPAGTAVAGVVAGGASTSYTVSKLKTAIADATATTVFTVTVPNQACAAGIFIEVLGSLGAGGAIGAFEVNSSSSYVMSVSRTAGVSAVIATSSQLGVASAAVAGATTLTATVAASAVTGAVGVLETFTIQVTLTKGGGASAAHQCILEATVINATAAGITIA